MVRRADWLGEVIDCALHPVRLIDLLALCEALDAAAMLLMQALWTRWEFGAGAAAMGCDANLSVENISSDETPSGSICSSRSPESFLLKLGFILAHGHTSREGSLGRT